MKQLGSWLRRANPLGLGFRGCDYGCIGEWKIKEDMGLHRDMLCLGLSGMSVENEFCCQNALPDLHYKHSSTNHNAMNKIDDLHPG